MRHGSLFSGIGGFDLAAEWMGWENVFHCEINEFCQKVLKKNFPNTVLYEDITKTNFTEWRGRIDIITGGFPCQPYSVAGKRKGKEDERHLWPQMLRSITEIAPSWVVGENVPGLINWSNGLVFDEVQSDLENSGFEVFPPIILPACAKNTPHRRDRLWIIAHSLCEHLEEPLRWNKSCQESEKIQAGIGNKISSNSTFERQQGQREYRESCNSEKIENRKISRVKHDDKFERQWPEVAFEFCRVDDGLSNRLDESKRISALGNAIVPQVAYEIFKAIELFNEKY